MPILNTKQMIANLGKNRKTGNIAGKNKNIPANQVPSQSNKKPKKNKTNVAIHARPKLPRNRPKLPLSENIANVGARGVHNLTDFVHQALLGGIKKVHDFARNPGSFFKNPAKFIVPHPASPFHPAHKMNPFNALASSAWGNPSSPNKIMKKNKNLQFVSKILK